jgi:peptide chain release factor 2
LKDIVGKWEGLKQRVDDSAMLIEMAREECEAPSVVEELKSDIEKLELEVTELDLLSLLSGRHDMASAIVMIHAGAGGTEACDWVQMLLRMYMRWAEQMGYGTQVLDATPGDEAGFRSVTVSVDGTYAYGYLKAERGVHRLVRISPFDANKRRHTSFASMDVVPEIEDDQEVEINEDDLKVDTYRSSGAGGQHVNVTDSAVRITHLPTGIIAQSQNDRSQHKNRATAMRILRSRVAEHYRREKEMEMEKELGEKKKIEWGSQIRSYVFQPYTMVKDHRTKFEVGNVQAVMDGDIQQLIESYLRTSKAS